MKKPIFSIVIPTYNEEKYLGFALQSLLEQDFPKEDYEIIIVDNLSSDKTVQIAKAFGVKVFFEQKKGVIFARQKGAKKAKGEFIVSFDADSEAPPDYLKRIYEDFTKNPSAIGVAGLFYHQEMPFLSRFYLEGLIRFLLILWTKIFGQPFYISATNFAFKKEVFEKIGGYPLINLRSADQRLFLQKLKKEGKIIFDPNLFVNTSARRIRKRILKAVIKDGITYTYLDPLFYKLTRRRLPGNPPDIR